ncbi:MAG: hypothetical protein JXJ04_08155 [Spirochaetales bacterium]|nr:hypothetical protein [Spirochaetales bacterium]
MIIASLSPYTHHIDDVIQHPLVDALRLNTSIPVKNSKTDLLMSLKEKCASKRLWLDLKTRQLRIVNISYYPQTRITLNHSITSKIPFDIYYRDISTRVIDIENDNILILASQPEVMPEVGESLNILDTSLKVDCYLTENDLEYIEAAKKCGIHNYMLSFVEDENDLRELINYDSKASIIAKIESQKGLAFVKKAFPINYQRVRLMAARNDLFVHLGVKKIEIITALRIIIKKDPQAIVASQILPSIEKEEGVSMSDLSDLLLLKILGYKHFLLNDSMCSRSEVFNNAMEVWNEFMQQVKKHEDALRRKNSYKSSNKSE